MVLASCATPALAGFSTGTIRVGDTTLTVAVADTPEERRQGLRGVERLPEGIEGMLFVFEEPTEVTFGMRGTSIPLDIWWFDAGGVLVGVTAMTPCPGEPCPVYASPGPVRWALETPQGEWDLSPAAVLSISDSE